MKITHTKIWKPFSSLKLAIWLLGIIALVSLIGTVVAQNEDTAFYISRYGDIGYSVLLRTGFTDIYHSWWFILLLILLSVNITACRLNKLSIKSSSLGTFLSHISILVILLGALVGMVFGQNGYIKINKSEEISAFTSGSKLVKLGFSIRLNDFIYNESVNPKEKLLVYSQGTDDFCKMHGPQQQDDKGALASISAQTGTEGNIADTGYKVKILRYVPDFVMDTSSKEVLSRSMRADNPAIQIELKDESGSKKVFWVFARFPDIHSAGEYEAADKTHDASIGAHQPITNNFKFVYNWANRQPKDFISKVTIIKDGREMFSSDIQVNLPLKFAGYTFFQSSYDADHLDWSGLRVVKDPGVSIVYLGFVLLILGLSIKFYINPFMKTLKKG